MATCNECFYYLRGFTWCSKYCKETTAEVKSCGGFDDMRRKAYEKSINR